MSLSAVTLSGTISKDGEQRFTPSNVSVISFTMNVLRYNSKEKQEKSYPVKVNLWGDSYTNIIERLKNGTRVVVSGRLQLNQFTANNGKNIRVAEIEANNLSFADSLSNSSNYQGSSVESQSGFDNADFGSSMAPASSAPSGSEEEIPF